MHFRPRIICALAVALTIATSHSLLMAEELPLRPLEPIVSELTKSEKPDVSELAYVSARGAALFTALSSYVDSNAAGERDKKLANDLLREALPFFQVAVLMGLEAKKTKEATESQIKILIEAYSQMMIRSKQLNNEIASPAVTKDLAALKLIEPVVQTIAAEIEKQTSGSPSK
ncbi:MAG: hypothetical protein HY302_09890 [Opitutae bacterium]|nr:hypothetical protein [Opitutae bacterium]